MKTTESEYITTTNLLQNYLMNFEKLPCGIAVIKNDSFATIVEANSAFYHMIGYTKEGFLSLHKNCMSNILIDYLYNVAKKQAIATNPNFTSDIRIRTENGDIKWLAEQARYNENDDVFIIIFTDITDKLIPSPRHLSYDAFQARNEILGYVNLFASEHIVITDAVTCEVVYMNPTASKLLGYSNESDWIGKSYCEIGFGNKENIPECFYTPIKEDDFTISEYYNDFHKIYVRAKRKLFTVKSLNRKMCCNIISDITAQKKLEQQIEMQTVLNKCIDCLFTSSSTNITSETAYYDILDNLKLYYKADRAFFYNFKPSSFEVEHFFEVCDDNVKKINHQLPLTANDEQIRCMKEFSKENIVTLNTIADTADLTLDEDIMQVYNEHQTRTLACKTIVNENDEIVAFIGVTNPRTNEYSKELMELLSHFICMFIEHEKDIQLKEKILQQEATSKANVIYQCVQNFTEFSHSEAHITAVLDSICIHYDADFAVTLTSDEKNGGDYGISHIGGSLIPNLDGLQRQPAYVMKKWHTIFQKHKYYITDVDLDSPSAKQLLREKFGIYNFIASPIRDKQGKLTGLLYIMNFKNSNHTHLLSHVVANNISEYLNKIELNREKHLEPMTRLMDKVATSEQIEEHLDDGTSGTLFIIDIDNFKNLNDTLGHQIGDNAILDIANNMKPLFRSTDVVGRVGGDEFMVFSPKLISQDLISNKAKQIIKACNLSYEKDGVCIEISVSIGICVTTDNFNTFHTLYKNADEALYVSKDNGKNQFTIYNKSSNNTECEDK